MDKVQKEIELLVSYLPKLYAADFKPVKQWDGGYQETDGAFNQFQRNFSRFSYSESKKEVLFFTTLQ